MSKLILKRSWYDLFANTLCLVLLIGILIYLIINWNSIPDKLPGHYNAVGEIDRMGNKGELLVLPIINWLMYLGMTAVERFPSVWNTGVRVTEENRERVYRTIKNMLSTMKLIIVAVFSYLTINSARALPLSPGFLPAFLILIFGSIILYIIRLVRVSK